jgi:pimeloyl-ACP methyl ester carboxylesterase
MDDLGLIRAALVGHSDGGTIALHFAADQPARAARVVVVAAHVYLEASMGRGVQGIVRQFENDARFLKGLRLAHGDKAQAVFRNWHDGWARLEHADWDMRPALARVACPTLVVQGEADEHATPQHARDIASGVPDGGLWLIPGIGHMVPQDAAPEFNAHLVEFLEPWHREYSS